MNSHFEIKKLLSAYAGDDLSGDDRTLVDEHLKGCQECRAELADMEITVKLLRTTPEVEPPPWLTTRIMAHVKEEKARKHGWLKLLLFPLHIKIPLEAMAIMVVCLSGYYLSRTVETELGAPRIMQDLPVTPKQMEAPRQKEIPAKPSVPPPDTFAPEPPARKSADRRLSYQHPVASSPPKATDKQESVTPSPGAAVEPVKPAPVAETTNQSMGAAAPMVRKKAASGVLKQEAETVSSAPVARGESDSAKRNLPKLSLRLMIPDGLTVTAAESVKSASIRSGAKIIEELPPVTNRLRLQIPLARMPELLERLGRIGRLTDRPNLTNGAEVLEVTVEW